MKKPLLFLTLMVLLTPWALKAQVSLTVYDGTATSDRVPAYVFYYDDFTRMQHVIPANDLADMEGGTITAIKYYTTSDNIPYTTVSDVDVYLMEVNYTKMEGLEPKSNGTIVYQGTLDFVAEGDGGSLIITLATPYLYGGGNLLVGIDNTTKLGWKDIYFYGQEVTEAGWGGASSTSLESVIGSVRNFIPKTTFTYEPGEAPECAKPRNLSINYTGGSEATVSWTGNATAWNIDVNGTVTAITENSYTLTNLELATTYEVKVQANCGNALSDWVTASFTTDLCLPADECAITIVLTDAYGDGWSGNKLEVVDDATEVVLGSYTLTDGGTGTFVLNVCNGREINFVYRALGYYQHENGYVITDINGEVICEHEGCKNAVLCTAPTDGLIASYIVDCTIITCKTPTNLAASEISAHSAKLTWTEKGEATAWKLAYKESTATEFTEVDATAIPFVLNGLDAETKYIVKVRPVCDEADDKWSKELSFTTAVACPAPSNMAVVPAPTYAEISWTGSSESYEIEWSEPASYTPSSEATWFLYDDDFYTESVGMSTAATWQFGVMYPATDLTGIAYLYKVAFYEAVQYESGAPLTISIYQGGDAAPETLLGTEEVSCTASNSMREVMLKIPVEVDLTKNLWIILTTTTIRFPMAMCSVDEANGRWIYYRGAWSDLATYAPAYATKSFMIRGYLDYTAPVYNWSTASNVESPYTINGLTTESDYVVRVKGDCGSEGESLWTWKPFTTPQSCPNPVLSAEVSAHYAKIGWTGYSDSYNVRYRVSNSLYESFEDGLGEWTTIDADADGHNWFLVSDFINADPYYETIPEWHMMGKNAIVSASYSGGLGTLTPDNWLVSPQVTLGGTISFFAQAGDDEYAEEVFGVFVSTTGNTNPADFQLVEQWTMNGNGWRQYIVDLSAYSGLGYVAIRHFDCTDQYMLVVDDIVIDAPEGSGNPWLDIVNTTAKVITINDLTPSTLYDVEVQGICGDEQTDWIAGSFYTSSVYNLTISDAKYATFYEKDYAYVLPESVDGYVFSLDNTPKMALAYEAGDTVPADMPLVLHANAGTYELIYTGGGEALAVGLNNDLIGVQEETDIVAHADSIYYVLSTAKPAVGAPIDYESVGFYWPNADGKQNFHMPAHKAYLKYLESALQNAAPCFLFDENGATSLDDLKGVEGTLKFIQDGNIYILREGVIYDATGRKVRTF